LAQEPHPSQLSLRIERFYHHSFANDLPLRMVMGTWLPGKPIVVEDIWKFNHNKPLHIQQDTYLLNKQIMCRYKDSLSFAVDQGLLGDDKHIDWFVPHLSSHIVFDTVASGAKDILGVPRDRVWMNLSSVGNVGAASWTAEWRIRPDLKKGDRIVLAIPESGNFSYHYVLLTVVDPTRWNTRFSLIV
jgi:3-oxoacyl-[acyl-carrier-protein] synthase III